MVFVLASNVWGQGASQLNGPFLIGYDRTVDRSGKSNMKFLFFSLARCFIGEKYEMRIRSVTRNYCGLCQPQTLVEQALVYFLRVGISRQKIGKLTGNFDSQTR